MKNTTIKQTFVVATLLAGSIHAGIVSAHDQGGGLGNPIGATDMYQVDCFNDGSGNADRLSFSILDLAPVAAPVISAQVYKYPRAANTTDQVDGNAAYSPKISVKGGNGAYTVIIDKSKAGAEAYSFQYHCETSSGAHTGTGITSIQNQ